ncbi:MAG: glycosyltransferase family 2 protein [Beijerinckiaceae bacterium]|jgi:glycosyltransferase involved in cell wall biosynthesis
MQSPLPRSRVALIIPTLNEEESIGILIASVPRDVVARIIVADGGSSDRTVDEARRAGAEVIHAGRGYGRACLAGAQAASDAEILVFMDGDGADDPASIAGLIAPIDAGTRDFILGSRLRGAAAEGSMAWHQRVAGSAIGLGMRALYGIAYTDMCAFRAIRRDALLALGMREMTYGWNLEMQMRAARSGLRILEVPVDNRRRIGGHSKVAGSLRGSLTAGTRILMTFARVAVEPVFLKPAGQ